jgi:hypothetical protein
VDDVEVRGILGMDGLGEVRLARHGGAGVVLGDGLNVGALQHDAPARFGVGRASLPGGGVTAGKVMASFSTWVPVLVPMGGGVIR